MQTAARWPIRLSPWTRPMLVVVLPSPSGVGVMAVTTTYLPRRPAAAASVSRRVIPSKRTLALYGPYCSTSSSRRPSSRASSMIGRGVTERAISRLLGSGLALIEQPLGYSAWVGCSSGPRPCRLLRLVRGGSEQVAQQQGVCQGPDAAGYRGDRAHHVPGRLKVHVADQPLGALAVRHDVDAHVHDHDARREHLAGDQAGLAGGHDQDLRVTGVAGQVTGPRMEDGHGAVLAHQQHGRGLADDVGPPDHYKSLAGDLDAGPLQDLDGGLGRGRQDTVISERKQAGIAGVDTVDVLGRVDRIDDGAQRNVRGQWHLDDDPGHARVRVEILDLVAKRVRHHVRAEFDEAAVSTDLLARPQDLLEVHGRWRVGADQHDRERRRETPLLIEGGEVLGQSGTDLGRNGTPDQQPRAGCGGADRGGADRGGAGRGGACDRGRGSILAAHSASGSWACPESTISRVRAAMAAMSCKAESTCWFMVSP